MRSLSITALLLAPLQAAATLKVVDDTGSSVSLPGPARRIVSLSPHTTELLFTAGAGSYVIGVSAYSDFPAAAKRIARVGSAHGLDLERIASLRPDLIVAWQSGNSSLSLDRLAAFGIPIFRSEPRRIEDIATTIERLGQLVGKVETARQSSLAFRRRYQQLQAQYADRTVVTVFYQVWDPPLMTVNRNHLISHVIRACGGLNVFAELPTLTPKIDTEAVLRVQPDVIVAAGPEGSAALAKWKRWPQLKAVSNGYLVLIPPPLIARHTPRLLDGAERLCARLDEARDAKR